MMSWTQAVRERRWNPPEYAFHLSRPYAAQDGIRSELTIPLRPHSNAARPRHAGYTLTRTGDEPPRITSPALLAYGHAWLLVATI
jgi:hypothetical protein